MFGLFGNRKKFNGDVDVKLNNEYDIQTRDNPTFPALDGYLKILDHAWSLNMTADEGAMFVASLYYCGLLKRGLLDQADLIERRLSRVTDYGFERGTISKNHIEDCVSHIINTRRNLGLE